MERAELIQSDVRQEQALVKELTSKAEAEKSDLQRRGAAIAEELVALQGDRKKLADATDSDALSRYGRLMRSKGDFAVVPIRNGNCGGCHLHIPPQVVHDAKHGEELTSCEYCGRILYWQAE